MKRVTTVLALVAYLSGGLSSVCVLVRAGPAVASSKTKAALSIGHTTPHKLLNAGELERALSKAGTQITADSVRRYAGLLE
jgi:hypothetical protein